MYRPAYCRGDHTLKVSMEMFAENRERLCKRLRCLAGSGKIPTGAIVILQGGPSETRFCSDHEPIFRQVRRKKKKKKKKLFRFLFFLLFYTCMCGFMSNVAGIRQDTLCVLNCFFAMFLYVSTILWLATLSLQRLMHWNLHGVCLMFWMCTHTEPWFIISFQTSCGVYWQTYIPFSNYFTNCSHTLAKNVQVKKTHSDQYAKVPIHGGSPSLFDLVIGLVDCDVIF
jgi:hypothetical protein